MEIGVFELHKKRDVSVTRKAALNMLGPVKDHSTNTTIESSDKPNYPGVQSLNDSL